MVSAVFQTREINIIIRKIYNWYLVWNMLFLRLSLWIFLLFVLSCCILLIRSELLILRNMILKIILGTNCNKLLASSKCLILRHFKLLWWSDNCFFIVFLFFFNMLFVSNHQKWTSYFCKSWRNIVINALI